MPRPLKKSPVGPERRRHWLKRLEEDGESPPQIAQKDGFDVRTVRKQLDMASQERETREARSMVLRKALEDHYADLVAVAGLLESALNSSSFTSHLMNPLANRSDRMWSALRDHLPRSPIWRDIDRWERLCAELTSLKEECETRSLRDLESKSEFKLVPNWDQVGLYLPELRNVIDDRLKRLVELGPFPVGEFYANPKPDGLLFIACPRGQYCAIVSPEQETRVKELLAGFMQQVGDLPEVTSMQKMLSELYRIRDNITDELATIRLRRVVPGRCRYCPI